MRASTFFALIIAVLLGLAAIGVVRSLGLFQRQTEIPIAKAPPPPTMVLVARTNLVKGFLVNENQVALRPLQPDELEDYTKNKAKYLPPAQSAVSLRITARDVEAFKPLIRDDFEPLQIPDQVTKRIRQGMRAVSMQLTRDRANGGVIRVGEYVDVHLTTIIGASSEANAPQSQTACLARKLLVVMKNDQLFKQLSPLPETKPISFTVEANPYRAALIEFAKDRGLLALQSLSIPPEEEVKLDQPVTTYSVPESKEYKDEDQRVEGILRGDRSVNDADLERIYNLQPIPAKLKPIVVQTFNGNKSSGNSTFPIDDALAASPRYSFSMPYHAGATTGTPPTGSTNPPAAYSPLMTPTQRNINATVPSRIDAAPLTNPKR